MDRPKRMRPYYAWAKNGKGKWSRNFDRCIKCKRSDSVHRAHGLCSKCHDRARYRVDRRVATSVVAHLPLVGMTCAVVRCGRLDGERVLDLRCASGKVMRGVPLASVRLEPALSWDTLRRSVVASRREVLEAGLDNLGAEC